MFNEFCASVILASTAVIGAVMAYGAARDVLPATALADLAHLFQLARATAETLPKPFWLIAVGVLVVVQHRTERAKQAAKVAA